MGNSIFKDLVVYENNGNIFKHQISTTFNHDINSKNDCFRFITMGIKYLAQFKSKRCVMGDIIINNTDKVESFLKTLESLIYIGGSVDHLNITIDLNNFNIMGSMTNKTPITRVEIGDNLFEIQDDEYPLISDLYININRTLNTHKLISSSIFKQGVVGDKYKLEHLVASYFDKINNRRNFLSIDKSLFESIVLKQYSTLAQNISDSWGKVEKCKKWDVIEYRQHMQSLTNAINCSSNFSEDVGVDNLKFIYNDDSLKLCTIYHLSNNFSPKRFGFLKVDTSFKFPQSKNGTMAINESFRFKNMGLLSQFVYIISLLNKHKVKQHISDFIFNMNDAAVLKNTTGSEGLLINLNEHHYVIEKEDVNTYIYNLANHYQGFKDIIDRMVSRLYENSTTTNFDDFNFTDKSNLILNISSINDTRVVCHVPMIIANMVSIVCYTVEKHTHSHFTDEIMTSVFDNIDYLALIRILLDKKYCDD